MSTFTLHPGALDRIRRELAVPLAEGGARIVVTEIQTYMEDAPPRTGRTYLVPGTATSYVASAPGEPPAIRTAVYRDSWEATQAVVEGPVVRAAAVSGLRSDTGGLLGEELEFGEPQRRLLPRPHIRPALANAEREIASMLNRFRST